MHNPSVEHKRQERNRLIESASLRIAERIKSLGSDRRLEIIKATISQLVDGIKERKWTATDLVSVYISQAIEAHKATNCLTEILFEPALKRAEELDVEFTATGDVCGRLHGVPLTFKDQYEIEGYDNTIGFTDWANRHATQDAELVAQARKLGGIPIAKTNVPQTMLTFECENPVWGKTTNPYSEHHSCGGSSGGEATVLRFSGSALGMGSDVGGSLRIPTAYCGIYSLKPTHGRFSGQGAIGCTDGFTEITTVYGPMARSVADVKYACETFFGLPPTVPSATLPPIKYRTDLDLGKTLRIGYYSTDRAVRASPACQRAVRESVQALENAGHVCVEVPPPDMVEILKFFVELSSADGYATMLSHLQSDKPDPAIFLITLGPRLPAFVRTLVSVFAQLVFDDTSFSKLFSASRTRSVKELWEASAARLAADQALQNHLWSQASGALGLDVVVCPVQAIPAIPHGATKTLTPLAASTIAWNVVECPVGVVPVTRVNPEKDALPSNWLSQEDKGGNVLRLVKGEGIKKENASPSYLMEQAVYGSGRRLLQPLDEPVPVYDAQKMKGLPVGVQIVGRPWEDEKVIHVMEILDKALGERGFGPGAAEEWKNA